MLRHGASVSCSICSGDQWGDDYLDGWLGILLGLFLGQLHRARWALGLGEVAIIDAGLDASVELRVEDLGRRGADLVVREHVFLDGLTAGVDVTHVPWMQARMAALDQPASSATEKDVPATIAFLELMFWIARQHMIPSVVALSCWIHVPLRSVEATDNTTREKSKKARGGRV